MARLSRPGHGTQIIPGPFPRPLAEPGVPVSGYRALHGSCRVQAWLGTQGLGIVLPRYRYRVTGTASRLNSSIPSAVIGFHRLPVAQYLTQGPGQPYPHGVAEAVLLSLQAVRAGDRAGAYAGVMEVLRTTPTP